MEVEAVPVLKLLYIRHVDNSEYELPFYLGDGVFDDSIGYKVRIGIRFDIVEIFVNLLSIESVD